MNPLLAELEEVSRLEGIERLFGLAAVLTKAFRAEGYPTPIVTGGTAVDFWAAHQLGTHDLDALLPTPSPVVDRVMRDLGFEKPLGRRHWENRRLDLFAEFPANQLDPGFTFEEVEIRDVQVRIVSLESILVDRIESHQATGYELDGLRAVEILRELKRPLQEKLIEAAFSGSGISPQIVADYARLAAHPEWDDETVRDALYVLHRKPR